MDKKPLITLINNIADEGSDVDNLKACIDMYVEKYYDKEPDNQNFVYVPEHDDEYIAIAYYLTKHAMDIDDAIKAARYATIFQGTYKEYVYELFEAGVYGECSKGLEAYLDWDFMAEELRYDYDEYEFDGKTYIIRQH